MLHPLHSSKVAPVYVILRLHYEPAWGFFPGHQTVPCALGSTQASKNEYQDIPGG